MVRVMIFMHREQCLLLMHINHATSGFLPVRISVSLPHDAGWPRYAQARMPNERGLTAFPTGTILDA